MTKTQREFNEYQKGMNEGGDGYNPHTAALAAEYAAQDLDSEKRFEADLAKRLADKDALWTRELTIQRRADWNTWVRNQPKGSIGPLQLSNQFKAQGWGTDDVKKAMKRHGLV